MILVMVSSVKPQTVMGNDLIVAINVAAGLLARRVPPVQAVRAIVNLLFQLPVY